MGSINPVDVIKSNLLKLNTTQPSAATEIDNLGIFRRIQKIHQAPSDNKRVVEACHLLDAVIITGVFVVVDGNYFLIEIENAKIVDDL